MQPFQFGGGPVGKLRHRDPVHSGSLIAEQLTLLRIDLGALFLDWLVVLRRHLVRQRIFWSGLSGVCLRG